MADRAPLVTNAASKKQVERAAKVKHFLDEKDRREFGELLDDPKFRRYLWALLGFCKINETIFEQSSRIYYNAGVQDVGHRILAQILEARPQTYLLMMQEADKEDRNARA
jgi:hypothetical protein